MKTNIIFSYVVSFSFIVKDNLFFRIVSPPSANYDVCNLLATKLIRIRISQCAACFDRWFPSGRPLHNYLIINYILFFFFFNGLQHLEVCVGK